MFEELDNIDREILYLLIIKVFVYSRLLGKSATIKYIGIINKGYFNNNLHKVLYDYFMVEQGDKFKFKKLIDYFIKPCNLPEDYDQEKLKKEQKLAITFILNFYKNQPEEINKIKEFIDKIHLEKEKLEN